MPVAIHPVKITGKWSEGYALDLHTTSSDFVGCNPQGRAEFNTHRSAIGELLYQIKFRANAVAAESLAETAADFLLHQWRITVDLLVPVPPSNTQRKVQPVLEVARVIGQKTGIVICDSGIKKIRKTQQLKDIDDVNERAALLKGAFSVDEKMFVAKRVLLFDDLYRSGATLNSVTVELMVLGRAAAVYAMALTRTRSKV